jgi:hypothetical protein
MSEVQKARRTEAGHIKYPASVRRATFEPRYSSCFPYTLDSSRLSFSPWQNKRQRLGIVLVWHLEMAGLQLL